jgi:hypothetical protein
MAYEGELVKMKNGRWARFSRCRVHHSGQQRNGPEILVAVELEDRYQELLRAAEDSIHAYRQKGIPVKVRLDPDGDGRLSLAFEGMGRAAAS